MGFMSELDFGNFRNWDICAEKLGSRVSEASKEDIVIDLDLFFCHGIKHSLHDARTFSFFSYFVIAVSPVLDIPKVAIILRSGLVIFDRSLLGYFLDLIASTRSEAEIKPLYELTLPSSERVFFENFRQDERYSKWGKVGNPFAEPEEKYLNRRVFSSNPSVQSGFEKLLKTRDGRA